MNIEHIAKMKILIVQVYDQYKYDFFENFVLFIPVEFFIIVFNSNTCPFCVPSELVPRSLFLPNQVNL